MTSASLARDDSQSSMGLPWPNSSLMTWLFLATEIMFFAALLGSYLILRQSAVAQAGQIPWPTPAQVRLSSTLGTASTACLILSSLTLVFATRALARGARSLAISGLTATLLLGNGFLGIQALEYRDKIARGMLPGRIGDYLDPRRPGYADAPAFRYKERIKAELRLMVETPEPAGLSRESPAYEAVRDKALAWGAVMKSPADNAEAARQAFSGGDTTPPAAIGRAVNALLAEYPELRLTPAIPHGNLWASCYFGLTALHALHVVAGLGVLLAMGLVLARGAPAIAGGPGLKNAGLYWHFLNMMWIMISPWLYWV